MAPSRCAGPSALQDSFVRGHVAVRAALATVWTYLVDNPYGRPISPCELRELGGAEVLRGKLP